MNVFSNRRFWGHWGKQLRACVRQCLIVQVSHSASVTHD